MNDLNPTFGGRYSLKNEITKVIVFVGVIWVAFLMDLWLPLSESLALIPRDFSRLPGVVAITFLHKDLSHIVANTVPLIVLLSLMVVSRNNPWANVTGLIVVGGGLLWLAGRNGSETLIVSHVGASLLIFALVTFLMGVAFFERRWVTMAVAVVVGFLYGGSILWGVLPTTRGVSWDGHLCGAIAGVIVASTQKKAIGPKG